MSLSSTSTAPKRARLRRLLLVVVAAVGLVAAGAVPAQAGGYDGRHGHQGYGKHASLKVMTRNIYLGSDLNPALAATTPTEFVVATTQIWGTVQFTNFPARAAALADEIDKARPDLIGLQEVSRWTLLDQSGAPLPGSLDYLALLQAQLAARGLSYSVAAVSDNASIGPVPLICDFQTGALCSYGLLLQDRDVILVNNARKGLHTWGAKSGSYATQAIVNTPVGALSFDRGWASVQASLNGKRFRFVDTHLETEASPAVQEAQAAEFLAGPAHTWGRVIAVGDFNSAADGSTTTSYDLVTKRFRDAWLVHPHRKGLSCCQNGTLTNPTSELATRIDLVLTRGAQPRAAYRVGTTPFEASPPLWASDHAGVVASLRLR
jgi:endonuclease/exonuclease/phosphatase family metal-dependent hydrolase